MASVRHIQTSSCNLLYDVVFISILLFFSIAVHVSMYIELIYSSYYVVPGITMIWTIIIG